MKIVCAWCGDVMYIMPRETGVDGTGDVSHGICDDCKARVLRERDGEAETVETIWGPMVIGGEG